MDEKKENKPKEIEEEAAPVQDEPDESDTSISTDEMIRQRRALRRLRIFSFVVASLVVALVGLFFYTRPDDMKTPLSKTSSVGAATSTAKKEAKTGTRIVISRLGIDETLYNMDPPGVVSQEALLKGATFYDPQTNMVGLGNCVIFGHSAVSSEHGAPFGAIGDGELRVGDKIIVYDADNAPYTYTVQEIKEIDANDFSIVQPRGPNEPAILTLITCIAPNYPKDKRVVAIASLDR
jgi:LPXTG-site transpeptidase (sortase) family protein